MACNAFGSTTKRFDRWQYWFGAVLCACLLQAAIDVQAQTVTLGAIEGTVTDESGGALPGVSITLTSPALQLPQITEVADSNGRYRFGDLRVGTYRLQFDLSGFQSFVREALELPVGFAARVDVVLKVGSLNETVIVSGASPVVDLTTTRGGQTVVTEVIAKTIPFSGTYGDLVRLTPGLSGGVGGAAGNPGRLGLSGLTNISAYGVSASGNTSRTIMLEEFEIYGNNTPGNMTDTEQMDVRTFGNTAEIGKPGPAVNLVYKSGGNDFHGIVGYQFINDKLQGDNIDDGLRAQGLGEPDGLLRYHDFHGNLGGRVVRDKLWFFGSLRARANERSIAGFVLNAGPDGQYRTGDEPPAYPTGRQDTEIVKLSYQMSPKYQLSGLVYRDYTDEGVASFGGFMGGGNATTVPFEASSRQVWIPISYFSTFRGTPWNSTTFDIQMGRSQYDSLYQAQDEFRDVPARWNRNTGLYTGAPINVNTASAAQREGRTGWNMLRGSLSYFPERFLGGRHELRMGFWFKWDRSTSSHPSHGAGNYLLIFDTISGLPNQAAEIITFSHPTEASSARNHPAAFIADRWQIGDRLTINLGARIEQQHSWVPAQSKEAAQFAEAVSFPKIDVGRWTKWAPRVAAAWDVTGSGKSVLKGTFGRYLVESGVGLNPLANTYNPVATVTTNYRWRDLNSNRDYDPGEVNLSLTGPDFISVTGGANTIINPDLEMGHIYEGSVSFERELMPNMGVRVLYVYKNLAQDYSVTNVQRPYSAFDIPLTRRDPGPDGVVGTGDEGGLVTIYDYNAAYRGPQFVANSHVNIDSDKHTTAQTIELSVNKRLSNRWSLLSSFGATKNRRWLVDRYASPNDEYFPVDETWDTAFRLGGSYELPRGFLLGGTLTVLPGVKGQRTNIFRAADPDGGPRLAQLTTVTLRLEPYGTQQGPIRPDLQFRLAKTLDLGHGELVLGVDFLNALNSNAAQAITFASGPTFGQITQIPSPRAAQLGVQYRF